MAAVTPPAPQRRPSLSGAAGTAGSAESFVKRAAAPSVTPSIARRPSTLVGSQLAGSPMKSDAEAPAPAALDEMTPEEMLEYESWQKEMDEAEEKKKQMEERRRAEIEESRRAEFEQRKLRERERQQREDEARRDANERQKMLDSIEKPLVELLERLDLLQELAMPLAKKEIFSLETLLKTQRFQLAEMMHSSGASLGSLDQVVVAARRSVAMERIAALQLPEDAEWEEKAKEKKRSEMESEEESERKASYGQAGYAGYRNRNANRNSSEEMTPEEMAEQEKIMQTQAKAEKPPVGPMRTALTGVVDRWYTYLGTVPALGEVLAREASTIEDIHHGDEEDEESDEEKDADELDASTSETRVAEPSGSTLGPTWKHTCAWALWMLTTLRGERMNRRQIETHLNLARDHVWRALYPKMHSISSAEWRMYWQRVWKSFASFFTEKCSAQWKVVAAADARTAALRAGKSEAGQAAAAAQAERLVTAMLKQQPRVKRSPTPAVRLSPPPLVAPPSGMAASYKLAHQKSLNESGVGAVKGHASDEESVEASAFADAASTRFGARSSPSFVAAAALTERFRQTPSRYLDVEPHTFRRRAASKCEAGARYCPSPKKPAGHEAGASTSRSRRSPMRQRPRSSPSTSRQRGKSSW